MYDSPEELSPPQEDTLGDPRGQKELFSVMWFETLLGTRYEMPDMLSDHISKAHKSLDFSAHDSQIIVSNISEVTLVIPKRIIKRAGVDDRCFWEALKLDFSGRGDVV